MAKAQAVVEELGRRWLFRERDLELRGISHEWMSFFGPTLGYVRYGRGVWGHPRYKPTRYDLLAIRFPHAVFWGPSALWLQGELELEPEALWIAIDNKARAPRTLDPTTVVIRARHHKRDSSLFRPPGRAITLLIHSVERARADLLARNEAWRRGGATGFGALAPCD